MTDEAWCDVAVATPIGTFHALLDGVGVRASGFVDSVDELRPLLRLGDQGAVVEPAQDGDWLARLVAAAVDRYFAGELRALDGVQVTAPRLGVRGSAWTALRAVPPGTTLTLARLARRAGRPRSVAGVAGACASNPVALFVPCHRVIDHPYLYGRPRHEWLLNHERT